MSGKLLEMRNITKTFPGVKALGNVSLSLTEGEIVCLLGENGAGKSTLMKILTGVYPDFEGEILLDGKKVNFRNTADAKARGISIVFQEFNLCPNLTAMENLFLGEEITGKGGLISYSEMHKKAQESFKNLRTEIDPAALVGDLGVAQQQMIEIAKALSQNTRILIMDEPTSALADREIESLFDIMRDLRKRGISIIFISHKLDEVMTITDRVVCLRDGQNSGEAVTADITENDLITMMVGRELDKMYSTRKGEPGSEVIMEVNNFSGPPHIKDVSFKLKSGEILGIAGLIGAGRTELARLIMGAEKKTAGKLILNGKEVKIKHPSDAIRERIVYVPEDRKNTGLVLPMTVRENTTMSIHDKIKNAFGLISSGIENRITGKYINDLKTKVSTPEQIVKNLSGGNQQKVVIAKCLAVEPQVLILDEPTRGIDVGAKAEVHRIITELADKGVAVIVISSELPEILHLSDRVLVMHEGKLTGEFSKDEANEESIMKAAVA